MTDRVAVVGAGQMGNGIAHVFAQSGFNVVMIDVSQDALDKGRATVAKNIGSASAVRAVGAANGANPVAIVVPCHRIVGSDGTLTGYGGGLERKEWLLRHERGSLFP